jgi:hypothetical protein
MIGHVSTGVSFFHCFSYCLEDKRELSTEHKINRSLEDGLQHSNRAEVLEYNKCFGDKYELTEQFNDVRKLSKRVEKPVLHLSVRLAPGEVLDRNQLIDIGREMAKDFGVTDSQYITVLHKDTKEQHIHLVANRVGYNGRAASTSNNFLKMDRLCRRLEKQYKLQEVLSARRFLPKDQQQIPRHDSRKEKLRTDIRQTLEGVKQYPDFEQKMQVLGYTVIKGRGISFIDDKKGKVKGSEVGFSLATIERILHLKKELEIKLAQEKNTYQKSKIATGMNKDQEKQLSSKQQLPSYGKQLLTAVERVALQAMKDAKQENSPIQQIQKELSELLYLLTKPEDADQRVSQELLQEARKKKKRQIDRDH